MARHSGRRRRPRFTVLVMVLASITLLTLDTKDVPVIGSIRSGMLSALAPVGTAFSKVGRPFRNGWKGVTSYGDLEPENRDLRLELDKLQGRADRGADLEETVRKLREQLDLHQTVTPKAVVARIATGNYSSFDDDTAQIDVGADKGVQVGNPVITNDGLVGRITRVAATRSVVQLVTDRDLEIGIRVPSDAIGVGHGTGARHPFIVDKYLTLDKKVDKGDLVTTSGLDRGIFPAGLSVGHVTKISRSQADQAQILDVRLSADLGELDYVQVLQWLPEKGA